MLSVPRLLSLLIVFTLAFMLPAPAAAQEDGPKPMPPGMGEPEGPPIPGGPGAPHPGAWKKKLDPAKMEAFLKARQKGELLFDLAMLYRKSGKADEALTTLRKIIELKMPVEEDNREAVELSGKRLMIYGVMADILREKKQYDAALKVLDEGQAKIAELTDARPDQKLRAQVELYKNGARIYQEMGKTDKAIENYNKALELVDK
jgi:tetratricopeptide (TPR) repeat protein